MNDLKQKVLIIGTGSIGKRHYRIFKDLLFCDTFIKSSNLYRDNELKKKGYQIFQENIKYDVGIIATSSDIHLTNISRYSEFCRILLVEKPIISIYNFETNLVVDNKTKKKVYVGYNKRFEKGISKLRNFIKNKKILAAKFTCLSNLENWRNQPVLDSISLNRERGGGVLNELSHEIDLSSFIIGKIKDIQGNVFQKKFTNTMVEDTASLKIKHKRGIESLVEISFASSFEERKIEIRTDREVIFYDHLSGDIKVKSFDTQNYCLIENAKEERDMSIFKKFFFKFI